MVMNVIIEVLEFSLAFLSLVYITKLFKMLTTAHPFITNQTNFNSLLSHLWKPRTKK